MKEQQLLHEKHRLELELGSIKAKEKNYKYDLNWLKEGIGRDLPRERKLIEKYESKLYSLENARKRCENRIEVINAELSGGLPLYSFSIN